MATILGIGFRSNPPNKAPFGLLRDVHWIHRQAQGKILGIVQRSCAPPSGSIASWAIQNGGRNGLRPRPICGTYSKQLDEFFIKKVADKK